MQSKIREFYDIESLWKMDLSERKSVS
jgi:ribosomal silencing factor RsfS